MCVYVRGRRYNSSNIIQREIERTCTSTEPPSVRPSVRQQNHVKSDMFSPKSTLQLPVFSQDITHSTPPQTHLNPSHPIQLNQSHSNQILPIMRNTQSTPPPLTTTTTLKKPKKRLPYQKSALPPSLLEEKWKKKTNH